MRISDWSSDVCSSDLHQVERLVGRLARDRRHLPGREGQADGQDITCCAQQGKAAVIKAAAVAEAVDRSIEGQQRQDRTRDVWGKSVSVRVDLGCLLIIEKKKKHRTAQLNVHIE